MIVQEPVTVHVEGDADMVHVTSLSVGESGEITGTGNVATLNKMRRCICKGLVQIAHCTSYDKITR